MQKKEVLGVVISGINDIIQHVVEYDIGGILDV